ncbi:putative lysosomal alpha-mannosidase, partial [Operophtera brumata]
MASPPVLLLLLVLVVSAAYCTPAQDRRDEQCGYRNCPASVPDVLNVHIVPHTHDDVGWLKTLDQYYYGSTYLLNCPASVRDVLNVHIVPHTHDDVGWLKTLDQYYYGSTYLLNCPASVRDVLNVHIVPHTHDDVGWLKTLDQYYYGSTFIYVETAFFWKWWVRQSDGVQAQVRTLVGEGRLVFVGGAWSMNDEAAAHYQSTVDQFTWGLRYINDTFGACALPRVGWQIDPFGHAREFASLLAGMGYDGLFLGRIDYQDKEWRKTNRNMEMLWRGDDDLGNPSDIFTGILYNTYSPPPGFCFDVLCNDEPIVDDVDSPMFNVDDKVNAFISIVRNMSLSYVTNNVLVTMGEDFQYQDAAMWYTNLDKLI